MNKLVELKKNKLNKFNHTLNIIENQKKELNMFLEVKQKNILKKQKINENYNEKIQEINNNIIKNQAEIKYNNIELDNYYNRNDFIINNLENDLLENEILYTEIKDSKFENQELYQILSNLEKNIETLDQEKKFIENQILKQRDLEIIYSNNLSEELNTIQKQNKIMNEKIILKKNELSFLDKKINFMKLEFQKNNEKRLKKINEDILQELVSLKYKIQN